MLHTEVETFRHTDISIERLTLHAVTGAPDQAVMKLCGSPVTQVFPVFAAVGYVAALGRLIIFDALRSKLTSP